MTQITAPRALYIKLGEGNRWAHQALETNTLRFGFGIVTHEAALAATARRDFQSIKAFYEERGVAPGTATRYSNEVREFYTAESNVLWITFTDGRMWWCFADAEVISTHGPNSSATGSRYRRAIGRWSDQDINGQTLWKNSLRGSLTTTEGFRGTICNVREFDYLLRRLNGESTAATEAVHTARLALIHALAPLIGGLHWKDFELLVELVMTQGGWRRVSATGGTQHTIDLELELPLTGERALVQVKSRLNQADANLLADGLADAAGGARVFIVYHTAPDHPVIEQENITLLGPDALAEHVVDLGLTTWVMRKVG